MTALRPENPLESFSEAIARDYARLAERGKALGVAMGLAEAAEHVAGMAGRCESEAADQALNVAAQQLARLAADRLTALDQQERPIDDQAPAS